MIVTVMVASGSAAFADNSERREMAPKGCVQPGSTQLHALERATQARDRASYESALRRRGLRRARIGGGTIQLHRGIRGGPSSPNRRRFPANTMVTATVNGVTGRYLAGNVWWTGSARRPSQRELVTDGKGTYYFVKRRPTNPAVIDLVLCGCAQRKCGPYGSGCPACHSTVQRMYGPFGPGDRFGGYIDVAYRSHSVRTRYQRGRCTTQRRCPAPPPSMRRR